MSVVSGITLQIDSAEDSIEPTETIGKDFVPIIHTINKWLGERNFYELTSVEDFYNGGKHPQVFDDKAQAILENHRLNYKRRQASWF
jgi:hypothetical protein